MPPYRFPPNSTFPDRLVTNQMGWRGPPIEVPRGPRTIRIVFVGSSTVIDRPLRAVLLSGVRRLLAEPLGEGEEARRALRGAELGAREQRLDRYRRDRQAPKCCRSAPTSSSTTRAATSSGPNRSSRRCRRARPCVRPAAAPASRPTWLRAASRWSALLGRVQAAIGLAASDMDGKEWPKPDYKVVWPPGLDEQDPDLAYPNLPVSLNVIQRDSMRSAPISPRSAATSRWLLRLDGEGRAGARPDPPPLHPRAAQRLELPVSAIATSSGWRSSRTGCSPSTRRRTASPSSTSRASCRSIPTCSSTPSIPATRARACAAGSRSTRSSR